MNCDAFILEDVLGMMIGCCVKNNNGFVLAAKSVFREGVAYVLLAVQIGANYRGRCGSG